MDLPITGQQRSAAATELFPCLRRDDRHVIGCDTLQGNGLDRVHRARRRGTWRTIAGCLSSIKRREERSHGN